MTSEQLLKELEDVATEDMSQHNKETEEYLQLLQEYHENQKVIREIEKRQGDIRKKCKEFHKKNHFETYIARDLGVQAFFFTVKKEKLNNERVMAVLPEETTFEDVSRIANLDNIWPLLSSEVRREIIRLVASNLEGNESGAVLEADARLLAKVPGFTEGIPQNLYDVIEEREVFQVKKLK